MERELTRLAEKHLYFHEYEIDKSLFLASPESIILKSEMIFEKTSQDIKSYIEDSKC